MNNRLWRPLAHWTHLAEAPGCARVERKWFVFLSHPRHMFWSSTLLGKFAVLSEYFAPVFLSQSTSSIHCQFWIRGFSRCVVWTRGLTWSRLKVTLNPKLQFDSLKVAISQIPRRSKRCRHQHQVPRIRSSANARAFISGSKAQL